MSLFASDLDRRVSAEAAGWLVLCSTVLSLWHAAALWRVKAFDTAKCALYILVAFPAVMGWLSVIYTISESERAALALGMNVARACALVAFLTLAEKVAGKDQGAQTSSQGQLLAVLVSIEQPLCPWSLSTVETARRFLWCVRASVWQHVVFLLVAGVAQPVLEWALAEDQLKYAEFGAGNGWTYVAGLGGLSAVVCGYMIINFGTVLRQSLDKRVSGLYTTCLHASAMIVATELQEYVLTLWALHTGETTASAHGFLSAVEMATAGCVQGWTWVRVLHGLSEASTRVQTIRTLMEHRDFSQMELAGRVDLSALQK